MSKIARYQAFIAIVEEGNLAKAARSLVSSPSSISKHLKNLEEELGVTLIERTTHALSVTETGIEFYRRAKDILNAIDDAEQFAKTQLVEPTGKLIVSIPNALIIPKVMACFADFAARYPDIQFDIKPSNEHEDLIEGKIDFAFRLGELKDSQLTGLPLGSLNTIFCAAPSYLKKHSGLRFNSLLQDGHLLIPSYISASSMHKLTGLDSAATQVTNRPCHSSSDAYTIDMMAKAGMGIAPMFEVTASEAIANGELQPIMRSKKFPKIPVHLVYHRRPHLPETMNAFKEFAKTNFPPLLK